MINYDLTMQRFFDEVKKYLEKRATRAADRVEFDAINAAQVAVCMVARNPKQFSGQYDVLHKVAGRDVYSAFSINDGVYRVVENVIYSATDLDSEFEYTRHEAQKNLLNALNMIKYRNSGCLLKDLYKPFLPVTYYAVKEKVNKR